MVEGPMIWYVDDDGEAMLRLQARQTSPFGPLLRAQSVEAVQMILEDLQNQGVEVETDATLTRIRESSGSMETVWRGRVLNTRSIADAREYFQRLALSYRGG
jgi:hypothetical protein